MDELPNWVLLNIECGRCRMESKLLLNRLAVPPLFVWLCGGCGLWVCAVVGTDGLPTSDRDC